MRRIEHNTRSQEMWDIITQHVDFNGKSVMDLGCGTGDFLWLAMQSGADRVMGVDIDTSRCYKHDNAALVEWDINFMVNNGWLIQGYDIVLCFSVLPYLDDIFTTVSWMRSQFPLCLIECQYAGDGPGPEFIEDDNDMRRLLWSAGFENVGKIGSTMVKEGRFERSIWMCHG